MYADDLLLLSTALRTGKLKRSLAGHKIAFAGELSVSSRAAISLVKLFGGRVVGIAYPGNEPDYCVVGAGATWTELRYVDALVAESRTRVVDEVWLAEMMRRSQ